MNLPPQAKTGAPLIGTWPKESLEYIKSCPVCGETNRKLLYDDLSDRIFFCAPGTWPLYQCLGCRSAYIDPRPTPDSIDQAYKKYFTHQAFTNRDDLPTIPFAKLRYALRNGYINFRFGYDLSPALWIGFLFAYLFPFRKAKEDHAIRHLIYPNVNPRLLDVGCGNGIFLKHMQKYGWDVQGIDLDPVAVSLAREQNLAVQEGSLSGGSFDADYFDAITINHVIEHLYDPLDALSTCFKIIRPGGILWIATPNLGSIGHRVFSKNWIGLDSPRHLVLFSPESLRGLITQTGFENISRFKASQMTEYHFQTSFAIERGDHPFPIPPILPINMKWKAYFANLWAFLRPELSEELILYARKPILG